MMIGLIFVGIVGFKVLFFDIGVVDFFGDFLNLVLKSFVFYVVIYVSEDVDDLVNVKGFEKGLWEFFCLFGEWVMGKVNVRDSNGVLRVWEDFLFRFIKFGDYFNL